MIKYLRTQRGGLGGELILMALSSFRPPTCCLARSAGPDPEEHSDPKRLCARNRSNCCVRKCDLFSSYVREEPSAE